VNEPVPIHSVSSASSVVNGLRHRVIEVLADDVLGYRPAGTLKVAHERVQAALEDIFHPIVEQRLVELSGQPLGLRAVGAGDARLMACSDACSSAMLKRIDRG
jgi:hypothetical protein